jgi:glucose/arabinose dehydrogenase
MAIRPVLRGRSAACTALLTALALLSAGCSGGDGSSGPSPGSSTARSASPSGGARPSAAPAKGSVKVLRTVTTGLDSPWGLAQLPDGDLLVSSRDTGRILRVDTGSGKKTTLGTVPGVDPGGEGGLLGIALAPDDPHLLYAYLTTASDNRVVRMLYQPDKPAGSRLGAPDTVFKGIPKGPVHDGGRIAFGPDGMLYVGTGETGERGKAQDRTSYAGKILRMTPDGAPVHGNPWPDSVVYSYGHRNVQGLAWDADGRLWASEFGQDTWDELNLVKPDHNYGWPKAEGKAHEPGLTDPVEQWRPDEASPSGVAVVRGSVWLAALHGERLWRVPLRGAQPAAAPQDFLVGKYGRLRTVLDAGGGRLWLVTSETDSRGAPGKGDDRILELKVS